MSTGWQSHISYLGWASIYSGSLVSNNGARTGAAASPKLQGSVKRVHKQRNKAEGRYRQKKGVERGWRGKTIWQIHTPLYVCNTYFVSWFWVNGPLVQQFRVLILYDYYQQLKQNEIGKAQNPPPLFIILLSLFKFQESKKRKNSSWKSAISFPTAFW